MINSFAIKFVDSNKKRKAYAGIMEARFGLGMKITDIARLKHKSVDEIENILSKYKAKQTGRDLVVIVTSKV